MRVIHCCCFFLKSIGSSVDFLKQQKHGALTCSVLGLGKGFVWLSWATKDQINSINDLKRQEKWFSLFAETLLTKTESEL